MSQLPDVSPERGLLRDLATLRAAAFDRGDVAEALELDRCIESLQDLVQCVGILEAST